jgi:hypothetical protein
LLLVAVAAACQSVAITPCSTYIEMHYTRLLLLLLLLLLSLLIAQRLPDDSTLYYQQCLTSGLLLPPPSWGNYIMMFCKHSSNAPPWCGWAQR